MNINMDPLQKQMLDDVFDAFSMLVRGTMVSLMHVEGGFTRYTPSAVELFGLPGEYIANGAYNWSDYLHPEDRRRYMDVMIPLMEGKSQTYDITYRVRIRNGEYGIFRAIGAVLRGTDGKPSLIGGAMFNEGMLNNIDPVTVLPNKGAFMEKLSSYTKQGRGIVCLLVETSSLSTINRIHGYTYGNRVLQEIAWLLQEIVRDRCAVFRMDGSEFALLADALSREQVSAIYDMIRYRLQRGIEINGIRNILNVNGGMLSVYGTKTEPATILSCLQYAGAESRQHKHGELVDFNGSIYEEKARSLELINAIRDSVGDGCRGFALEYEPVFDVQTGAVNGCEGTIYWEDPVYGKVEPEEFLPILEHDFIFEELGEFMIHQGLTEGVRLLEKAPGFLLCLNVYRIQLDTDYFVEDLLEDLQETGFPPELLSLKFESDCQYIDTSRLEEIIRRLHEQKILVILDGFGSGEDSIGFLKKVPVDAVCLDSHFLEGIEQNQRDRDILKYLTMMAATCVQHINTKGVETEAQREILRTLPVTTMQGRLFTEPLTFDEVVEKYYS